ncbi:hypothetical protein MMC20_001013 [Loxospora ochrophaea]|nr:hypothetical protein [Loxospora ochrophaea]
MSNPHPFVRTQICHLEVLSVQHASYIVRWANPGNSQTVHEIASVDPTYKRGAPDSENYIIPPMHWHWYQDEFFTIKRGAFIFTLEGKDIHRHANDGLGAIKIPKGFRHTFRVDQDCQEDRCEIEFTADDVGKGGLSETIFRNIYGYLDDCEKNKCAPSPVQMLLLFDSAEMSLALPGPRWIANPVSWLLGIVVGRWLGRVLGYKVSYPEYSEEKKCT